MNRPNDWFPAKRYGIGWGLPRVWQGWVVLILHFAIILTAVFTLLKDGQIAAFMAVSLGATAALVTICWIKGEPIRWQWGDRDRR